MALFLGNSSQGGQKVQKNENLMKQTGSQRPLVAPKQAKGQISNYQMRRSLIDGDQSLTSKTKRRVSLPKEKIDTSKIQMTFES